MGRAGDIASGIQGFTSGLQAGNQLRSSRNRQRLQEQEIGLRSQREARRGREFDQTISIRQDEFGLRKDQFTSTLSALKRSDKRKLNERNLRGLAGLVNPKAGFGAGDVPTDIILNDEDFKNSAIGKGAKDLSVEDGQLTIEYQNGKKSTFTQKQLNAMLGFFIEPDKRATLTPFQTAQLGIQQRTEARAQSRELRLEGKERESRKNRREDVASDEIKDITLQIANTRKEIADIGTAKTLGADAKRLVKELRDQVGTFQAQLRQRKRDLNDLKALGSGESTTFESGLRGVRQRRALQEERQAQAEESQDFKTASDPDASLEDRKEALNRFSREFPGQQPTGVLSARATAASPGRTKPQERPSVDVLPQATPLEQSLNTGLARGGSAPTDSADVKIQAIEDAVGKLSDEELASVQGAIGRDMTVDQIIQDFQGR